MCVKLIDQSIIKNERRAVSRIAALRHEVGHKAEMESGLTVADAASRGRYRRRPDLGALLFE